MMGKSYICRFKSVVKLPHRYPFLKYFRYITIKTVYRQKSNKIRLIPSNLAIHKQSADITKLKKTY
jgi:hypothetical protein